MEDQDNPFASPLAVDLPPSESHDADWPQPLARRSTRLGAAIIDGIILAVVLGLPMFIIRSQIAPQPRIQIDPNASIWEIYSASQPSLGIRIFNLIVGVAVFTLVHGYFLKTNGQTVGKKLLGIKIVRTDGSKPTLGHLIGLRYVTLWVASLITGVGLVLAYVDPLLIFRRSRKCLHDNIADTIVITAD